MQDQRKTFVDSLHTDQEAYRWRNLYFIRGRKPQWSYFVFETARECRKQSTQFFDELRDWLADDEDNTVETWSGDLVNGEDFLFAIPMPWKNDVSGN